MNTHDDHPNTLSALVRRRRRELGLSVKAASDRAGISPFRWNWVERAATPRLPEPQVVIGIAQAIEVPPAALVEAAGYPIEMNAFTCAERYEEPVGEARP